MAIWLKRLLTSNKETKNWTQIPLHCTNKYLCYNILLNCKIDKTCFHDNIMNLPPFWQDLLTGSSKINTDTENDFTSTQQIWLNRLIVERVKNNKNVLLLRNWIRSGILLVKDLCFKDGILDCESMYIRMQSLEILFT